MSRGAPRAALFLALAGLPIGFSGSLAGIGGGLIASSILHFVYGFEMRRATGTALVLVFATTSAATLTELCSPAPALSVPLLLGMLPGVLLGAQVGFRISERIPDRALWALFASCMLYSAIRLAIGSSPAAGADPEALQRIGLDLDASFETLLTGALVGFGGGLASPLLGVGGGLVMVPGLHLAAGLSFDVARASSLAAGSLGAARSTLLKARAGRVSWPEAWPLGAGALIGAALGVVLLKRYPALAQAGRWFLCALLFYVGGRYALRFFVTSGGPSGERAAGS